MRQLIIKLVIALLALGVCACSAYGMSQIDTQLVRQGLSVITSMKVWSQFTLQKGTFAARIFTPRRCSAPNASSLLNRSSSCLC